MTMTGSEVIQSFLFCCLFYSETTHFLIHGLWSNSSLLACKENKHYNTVLVTVTPLCDPQNCLQRKPSYLNLNDHLP